jgi:predicted AAA+ superfamily ATPase
MTTRKRGRSIRKASLDRGHRGKSAKYVISITLLGCCFVIIGQYHSVSMNRDCTEKLRGWKASPHRKPLILRGARQTGKTHLLREFGITDFRQCHYFNFEQDSQLSSLFANDLRPDRILRDLETYARRPIQADADLIFFDEIQSCPSALTALKYFQEEAPAYHIVAAGSLLGVRMSQAPSFPVGKVDFLDLHPMTFLEFLDAVGASGYRARLENPEQLEPLPEALHLELVRMLRDYHITGGMPEVVARHAAGADGETCRTIQRAILDSYMLDFAKHAPASDIPKLSLLWKSLPSQLSRENKKFLFSLVKHGARAREYENALTWLENAGLVHRCSLDLKPEFPLPASADSSSFKIYALDVGLLGALAETPPIPLGGDFSLFGSHHGAFAENFAAQTLVALGARSLHYWKNPTGTAEVDFLHPSSRHILPLEIKAGTNVRSHSLAFYHSQFHPPMALRATMQNLRRDGSILNIPLYALPALPQILAKV